MANKSKALKSLEDQLKSSSTNLKAGTAVLAKWRDGEEREAFVLERRLISTEAPTTTTTVSAEDGESGTHQIRDVSAYRYYCAWCKQGSSAPTVSCNTPPSNTLHLNTLSPTTRAHLRSALE